MLSKISVICDKIQQNIYFIVLYTLKFLELLESDLGASKNSMDFVEWKVAYEKCCKFQISSLISSKIFKGLCHHSLRPTYVRHMYEAYFSKSMYGRPS